MRPRHFSRSLTDEARQFDFLTCRKLTTRSAPAHCCTSWLRRLYRAWIPIKQIGKLASTITVVGGWQRFRWKAEHRPAGYALGSCRTSICSRGKVKRGTVLHAFVHVYWYSFRIVFRVTASTFKVQPQEHTALYGGLRWSGVVSSRSFNSLSLELVPPPESRCFATLSNEDS